jgi:hypothetical protein
VHFLRFQGFPVSKLESVESVECDGLVCPSCADSVLLFLSCASRDCVCTLFPRMGYLGSLLLCLGKQTCRVQVSLCRWEARKGSRWFPTVSMLLVLLFDASVWTPLCLLVSVVMDQGKHTSALALFSCRCACVFALLFAVCCFVLPLCVGPLPCLPALVLPAARPCALVLFRFHVFSVWKMRKVRKPCAQRSTGSRVSCFLCWTSASCVSAFPCVPRGKCGKRGNAVVQAGIAVWLVPELAVHLWRCLQRNRVRGGLLLVESSRLTCVCHVVAMSDLLRCSTRGREWNRGSRIMMHVHQPRQQCNNDFDFDASGREIGAESAIRVFEAQQDVGR